MLYCLFPVAGTVHAVQDDLVPDASVSAEIYLQNLQLANVHTEITAAGGKCLTDLPTNGSGCLVKTPNGSSAIGQNKTKLCEGISSLLFSIIKPSLCENRETT